MQYQKNKKFAEIDHRFLGFTGKVKGRDGGFNEEFGSVFKGGEYPCFLSMDKNRIVESQIEREQSYYRYAMNLQKRYSVGPSENPKDSSLRRTLKGK